MRRRRRRKRETEYRRRIEQTEGRSMDVDDDDDVGEEGERKERALLSKESAAATRVICEDAPAAVITWDLPALSLPREGEDVMRSAAGRSRADGFLLLLWGVTSHDPGMFMRPDSRRPWMRREEGEAESKHPSRSVPRHPFSSSLLVSQTYPREIPAPRSGCDPDRATRGCLTLSPGARRYPSFRLRDVVLSWHRRPATRETYSANISDRRSTYQSYLTSLHFFLLLLKITRDHSVARISGGRYRSLEQYCYRNNTAKIIPQLTIPSRR